MKRDSNSGGRITAIVIALALAGAACGGSDHAATDDAEGSFATTTAPAVFDDGSGGDGSSGDDGAVVDAEEERNVSVTATTLAVSTVPSDLRGAAVEGGEFGSDRDRVEELSPEPPTPARIRPFVSTSDDPLSTFALDVDTGSYSLARNQLNSGRRPNLDEVRVEEFVNSFDYEYDDPRGDSLGISIDGAPSPLAGENWLLRIGVQGERIRDDERPAAHLTFVVDTSGSMDVSNRLPLVRSSLELLVSELEDRDTVAIVTYNDRGEVLLEPTSIRDSTEIFDAIRGLRPGGSTNLEAGLRVGYELAREVNEPGHISRVIVASDGLANAGVTNVEALGRQIRDDADNGIRLMTVGYGLDGFNDATMEQLADQSDGVYAYVDTLDEAEKVFEDNLTANLYTIAVDAKIQVEFEADVVDQYRLIGFENRGVLDRDFRNDDVDAGEIGAGHQVTALYELRLNSDVDTDSTRTRLGEVNLRWEDPDDGSVIEIDETIRLGDFASTWGQTSDEFKLAGTVGAFAELLRESPYADTIDWDMIENEVRFLRDTFETDEVAELYDLVVLAGQV